VVLWRDEEREEEETDDVGGGTRGLARVGGRLVIGGCSAAGKARRLSHVEDKCLRRKSTKILAKVCTIYPFIPKENAKSEKEVQVCFFWLFGFKFYFVSSYFWLWMEMALRSMLEDVSAFESGNNSPSTGISLLRPGRGPALDCAGTVGREVLIEHGTVPVSI
jgi:hypothetical protein